MGDEGSLVQRLRARDESAFVELVRLYHGPMISLARLYVPSREVAEEVIQEAWVGVLRGIDRFEERSSFKTWLSRIVMNIARTRGARERRMVPFAELAEGETGESYAAVDPAQFRGSDDEYPDHWSVMPRTWNVDPEKSLLASEAVGVVERSVAELPEAQRLVVTLRDMAGWTGEEVCNALEISDTNQRVLLHRARSRIRAVLDAYYASPRTQRDRNRPDMQRAY